MHTEQFKVLSKAVWGLNSIHVDWFCKFNEEANRTRELQMIIWRNDDCDIFVERECIITQLFIRSRDEWENQKGCDIRLVLFYIRKMYRLRIGAPVSPKCTLLILSQCFGMRFVASICKAYAKTTEIVYTSTILNLADLSFIRCNDMVTTIVSTTENWTHDDPLEEPTNCIKSVLCHNLHKYPYVHCIALHRSKDHAQASHVMYMYITYMRGW